ncbi:hypothetical protein QAD02_009637 [Eretmocerus hayati]|uniref:Uncharacterized protein n=1 Tax=Eretmocerus hayati TaxID=131215 RepID=A0ACC2N9T0_9HYME|nr:hypothetical protein QAD02_009637 [Eretmocerus hayati]
MEDQIKKYQTYERKLKFMLACSGLWPNYENYPNSVRKVIIICCGFVTFGICFGAMNFCIHFGSNIGLLTRGGGILLGYSLVFLKVFLMGYYQTDLQKLKDTVSSSFAQDLKDPENRPHLLVYFPTIKTFFYIFNYFLLANNVVMTTMPLHSLRQGKYIRALPNIPPFSYEPGGNVHWMLYAFEIASFFFLWSVTCGVDSFFGYYVLHMVGEFRLLSVRFSRMKSGGKYREELKQYIDRHNQLIECQRILEKIFGFVAIWLGVTCAVSLCTLIWQLSRVD